MSENQQDQSKGLPMTAKWDPEKLEREKAELRELETKPLNQRAWGYIKRSGPGLLQSAMTLGAGSATASVVAGASFGYKLLWVQPVAMFFGVMMFAALGNIVLTTGERPYKAFMRELSIILVFLWAFGTICASVIWHFPQYGLAAGSARTLVAEFTDLKLETEGEMKDWFGHTIIDEKTGEPKIGKVLNGTGKAVSYGTGLAILLINCVVVFGYGSGSRGIKIYEWFLRTMIALVVLMFALVFIVNIQNIQWLEMFKGFTGYYGIPDKNPQTLIMVMGMLGAAVGINMTFLYPYSLLAKGWGKEHKTASRWDLGLTMFLPFVLVTSLIIIAMTVSGVYVADGARTTMNPLEAAKVLENVLGKGPALFVFCGGLIGMCCTAISAHMVVCGFTMCEMLGLEYTKKRFRLFAMTPAIGYFGVVLSLPLWLPIVASAICFTMMPIAYLIFMILNNKRSYIGDAVGKGIKRELFNVILALALIFTTIGAGIQIKQRVIDPIFSTKAAAAQPANDADAEDLDTADATE